jgi:MazG family protein
LLEEAYEVLATIDQDDAAALAEELGDLLIQVALHVQIATEEGESKLSDVIGHVVEKLVRRHPHVFGDVSVADSAEVARNWEAIKQTERKQAGGAQKGTKKNMLDGVPKALPALAQAQTYVARLARVGYPLPPLQTMDESELGRALLKLVEQAEVAGLDAESALRRTAEDLRLRLAEAEANDALVIYASLYQEGGA